MSASVWFVCVFSVLHQHAMSTADTSDMFGHADAAAHGADQPRDAHHTSDMTHDDTAQPDTASHDTPHNDPSAPHIHADTSSPQSTHIPPCPLHHNPFQSPPTPIHRITHTHTRDDTCAFDTCGVDDASLFETAQTHDASLFDTQETSHVQHAHDVQLMTWNEDDGDDMFVQPRVAITSGGQTTRVAGQRQQTHGTATWQTQAATSTSKPTVRNSNSNNNNNNNNSNNNNNNNNNNNSNTHPTINTSTSTKSTPIAPPLSPALLAALVSRRPATFPPRHRRRDIIRRDVMTHDTSHAHDTTSATSHAHDATSDALDAPTSTSLYGRAPITRAHSVHRMSSVDRLQRMASHDRLHHATSDDSITPSHDDDPLDICIADADVDVATATATATRETPSQIFTQANVAKPLSGTMQGRYKRE